MVMRVSRVYRELASENRLWRSLVEKHWGALPCPVDSCRTLWASTQTVSNDVLACNEAWMNVSWQHQQHLGGCSCPMQYACAPIAAALRQLEDFAIMVSFEQFDHVIASKVIKLKCGRFEGYPHELEIHEHYQMPRNQVFASTVRSSMCCLAVLDLRNGAARAIGTHAVIDLPGFADDDVLWYVACELPGKTLPQSIIDEIEQEELWDPNTSAPRDTEHVTQLLGHRLQVEWKIAERTSGDLELTSLGVFAEPTLTYATVPPQEVLDDLARQGRVPVTRFDYWNQSGRQLHLTDEMLACCLGELLA